MASFVVDDAYHLRLTTDQEFDVIEAFVRRYTNKYIISSEVGHYHCYIVTKTTRKDLRLDVNEHLALKGNGQFSIADVRKPQQMKKYILKDGYYRYKGFSDAEIEKLKKTSHKKGMSKYAESLTALEDDYLTSDCMYTSSINSFMRSVVELQLSYGMKPNYGRLSSYLRYIKMKKNARYIDDFVQEITGLGNFDTGAFKFDLNNLPD